MKNFKMITALLYLALLSFSQFAFSHGDDDHKHDDHSLNNVDAQNVGLKTAKLFSEVDPKLGFGKLTDSWAGLSLEATTLHASGDGYYIVAVENSGESKTLYVLMSTAGDVFDANFSGEFPNLKSNSAQEHTHEDGHTHSH